MRDVVNDISRWIDNKDHVALATVIQTWGSAPRQVGAKMAVTGDSDFVGSVSGGCVESAVIDACLATLASYKPQLLSFGVSDEMAWDVGLACGGKIDVFVEHLSAEIFTEWQQLLIEDEPFIVATVVSGDAKKIGQKLFIRSDMGFSGDLSHDILRPVLGVIPDLRDEFSRRVEIQSSTSSSVVDMFFEVVRPAPKLILIGGVHIGMPLSRIAKDLGYKTIVVDPRRAFTNERRFPDVDRLIHAWPDDAFKDLLITSNTAVVSLSHDPKIDDPALKIALTSPAFYIGALGSRKTHEGRRQRLSRAGISKEQLSRIHGPIGLDIGAQTPEEIAVSIMAEIIATSAKSPSGD